MRYDLFIYFGGVAFVCWLIFRARKEAAQLGLGKK